MRKNFIFLFLSFLFLVEKESFAQKYPMLVGLRWHRGFIIPHAESIKNISYSRPWGLELDLGKHINSQQAWNQCSCYPRVGLSLAYFNFANPSILGNSYWIMPYIEPFLGTHRRLSASFRFGVGATFLDKIYHPINNPQNYFYSMPISFVLSSNISLNYKIQSSLLLRLQFNYNHISNGGLQEPNKGINFPTLSLALDYTPQQDFSPRKKEILTIEENKNQFLLYTFFSAKTTHYGERKRYPLYGMAFYYRRLMGVKSAFTTGFEAHADWALRKSLDAQEQNTDHHKVAWLVGHDFMIGKFALGTHLGTYIYAPKASMDKIYQRYLLSYRWQKYQFAFSLKAHRHVADFLDLRIGLFL